MRTNLLLALSLAISACAGPALAGASSDPGVTTTTGKDVRLGAYAVFRRDCSGGAAADVRPAGDQRSGVLVISPGTLATTRIPNCGKVESPARIIVYRPNPGFVGTEQVTYDVVDTATGQSQTHVVLINVTQ